MRSKRFEALAKRPVNQDGFVKEWIEEGFIARYGINWRALKRSWRWTRSNWPICFATLT